LEEAAARFARDLLKNLFAIRMLLPQGSAASASATTAAHSHAAERKPGLLLSIGFAIGKQDRVDQCVGSLRSLDAIVERLLAALIGAVGQEYESFAPFLLPLFPPPCPPRR